MENGHNAFSIFVSVECLVSEHTCRFSTAEVEALFEPNFGTWTVTDAVLDKYDLQNVIDCAKHNDTIHLQTSKTIQPLKRIEIGKNLTIRGVPEKGSRAVLTCPKQQGLFLFT